MGCYAGENAVLNMRLPAPSPSPPLASVVIATAQASQYRHISFVFIKILRKSLQFITLKNGRSTFNQNPNEGVLNGVFAKGSDGFQGRKNFKFL
jgi:hypothetical protein